MVYPVLNNTALYTKYVFSPAWIGNAATPIVPGYSLSFIPCIPYEDGPIPYAGPMVATAVDYQNTARGLRPMVPTFSLGFPTVPLVLHPPYYPPSFPVPPMTYNEYDNRPLQAASQKRSATAVKSSQASKQRCLNNSVSGGGGGKKSFVTCIYCNNYNTWRSSNPPKSLICSACGHILFLEKLPRSSDLSNNSNDSQILVVNNRMRSMDPDYYGRHALLIRDIRHVISGLLYRVEKAILKEERQIQDDVQDVLSDILSRVEHYLLGHLHCCCLQPALSQRHFIQCNKCDLWFHTSCVGISYVPGATQIT